MRIFKLLVKDSGALTLNILKYFNKNICDINRMGVVLQITKIEEEDLDKDLVENLASSGICRFPALINDTGKIFLGVQKIRDLFDRNIQSFRKQAVGRPAGRAPVASGNNTEFGSNPDLAAFWHQEMKEDESQENDDISDTKKDLDKRLRDYRPPKHRQDRGGRNDLDMDARLQQRRGMTTGRQGGGAGGPRQQHTQQRPPPRQDDDDEDNIEITPMGSGDIILESLDNTDHEDDNPMDAKMERALFENKASNFSID